MPEESVLARPLLDLLGRASWWRAHLFLEDAEELDDPAVPPVAFPLPGGARLLLTVTSFSSELEFAADGGEPVSVAWDDQAHWHPTLFRWVEFEAVVAHAAAAPPWSARPDLVIALLHRFAAVTADAERDHALEMVGPPLRALGLVDTQVEEALGRIDWRPGPRALTGPGWVRDDSVGWRLELEAPDGLPAAYSLRRPDNPDFPRGLAAVLDRLAPG